MRNPIKSVTHLSIPACQQNGVAKPGFLSVGGLLLAGREGSYQDLSYYLRRCSSESWNLRLHLPHIMYLCVYYEFMLP